MDIKDYYLNQSETTTKLDNYDAYAYFPTALKSYNIPNQYQVEFKDVEFNPTLKKAFLFCRKSLKDPEAHTMEKYVKPDAYVSIVYSQKVLADVFLKTLNYRKEQQMIDSDLQKVMSTFIKCSFIGNKINYLINFSTLDEISQMDSQTAMRIMSSHLFVARASMNWIYAEYSPNLQGMLKDAKETTLRAILSRPLYADGVEQCDTVINQWKFTYNHIYGDKLTPPWIKNRNDIGVYLKSRKDIEERLETPTTLNKRLHEEQPTR